MAMSAQHTRVKSGPPGEGAGAGGVSASRGPRRSLILNNSRNQNGRALQITLKPLIEGPVRQKSGPGRRVNESPVPEHHLCARVAVGAPFLKGGEYGSCQDDYDQLGPKEALDLMPTYQAMN